MARWRRVAAIMIGIAVAGCTSGIQPPSPQASTAQPSIPESALTGAVLAMNNGTSIAVTLLVNAVVITTVPASTREQPVPYPLPSPPWDVEARSPSGRILLRLRVSTSDLESATSGIVTGARGRFASADLSCGRLEVWTGPAPVGAPTFIPGPPGDCR